MARHVLHAVVKGGKLPFAAIATGFGEKEKGAIKQYLVGDVRAANLEFSVSSQPRYRGGVTQATFESMKQALNFTVFCWRSSVVHLKSVD